MHNIVNMIQIEDWVILAGLLTLLILFFTYLLYFKVSKKLFPENLKFEKEISPQIGSIICEIKGSGIVKAIELQTTNNCLIAVTIDSTNHTLLNIEPENKDINSGLLLTIKENLDQKFEYNCAIHILNQSDKDLKCIGNASYEIKKKFSVTLKTVFTELT
jgi:hypothetical protein